MCWRSWESGWKNIKTVKIYSNRANFDARTQSQGIHNADAYFDPTRQEIGLYVDKRLFQWIGYQSDWSDRDLRNSVLLAVEYVNRLFIKNITHEVYHFLQSRSQNILYENVLWAEGSATFVQANVLDRDELAWLSYAYSIRGLQHPDPNNIRHPCENLIEFAVPLGNLGGLGLLEAAQYVWKKYFSSRHYFCFAIF